MPAHGSQVLGGCLFLSTAPERGQRCVLQGIVGSCFVVVVMPEMAIQMQDPVQELQSAGHALLANSLLCVGTLRGLCVQSPGCFPCGHGH